MKRADEAGANRRVAWRLGMVVVAMFAFGYALVPLYDVFCDITGLNGKTGRVEAQAAQATSVDRDRTVTVEFIGIVNADLPWRFRPVSRKMTVHPGEIAEAHFTAMNQTMRAMTGHAVPSVAPSRASRYFNKTECFCFTEQELGPGETRDMPVRFIVDPALPGDVGTLTLSYTFFESKTSGSARVRPLQATSG